jgi:hypothetical protein
LDKGFQEKVNSRFCSASKDLSDGILIGTFGRYSSYEIKIKTKKIMSAWLPTVRCKLMDCSAAAVDFQDFLPTLF